MAPKWPPAPWPCHAQLWGLCASFLSAGSLSHWSPHTSVCIRVTWGRSGVHVNLRVLASCFFWQIPGGAEAASPYSCSQGFPRTQWLGGGLEACVWEAQVGQLCTRAEVRRMVTIRGHGLICLLAREGWACGAGAAVKQAFSCLRKTGLGLSPHLGSPAPQPRGG